MMGKIFLLAAVLVASVYAQSSGVAVPVTMDQSGSCTGTYQAFNTVNNKLFACVNSTWQDITNGGSGGSSSSGNATTLQGQPVSTTAPTAGQFLTFSNGTWTPYTLNVNATPPQSGWSVSVDSTSNAVSLSQTPRTVSGTTDTITASDCAQGVIKYTNASQVAISINQAGPSSIPSGCVVEVDVMGAGGAVLTPTTSTIGGQASLTMTGGSPQQPNSLVFRSDGTNFAVGVATASSSSSGNATTIQSQTVSSATPSTYQTLQFLNNTWTPSTLPVIDTGWSTTPVITNGIVNVNVSQPTRTVTGTTDNVTVADCKQGVVRYTAAGQVAVTINQAGVSISDGCVIELDFEGTGGAVLTPNTSTIGGGSSITISGGTASQPNSIVIRADNHTTGCTTNGCFTVGERSGGSSGSSGTSVGYGTFSAMPGTCTTGQMYMITSGNYDYAICTGTNTWTVYSQSTSLSIPAALSLSSNSYSLANNSVSQGFETISMVGNNDGSSITGTYRYWTAPTAPYTRYLFLNIPTAMDTGSYRIWTAGFEDSTGARQEMACGTGTAAYSVYQECQIRDVSSSNSEVRKEVGAGIIPTTIRGKVIVGLQDDGANLHFSICSRVGACTQFAQAGRTSFLSSPTRLVYGFSNTGPNTGAIALDFLGTN